MAERHSTASLKFRRLAQILGSEALAFGHLEFLRLSCYEHVDDYLGFTEDVEFTAKWGGDPGQLTKALLHCQFISVVDGHFVFNDLWDNAPGWAKRRRYKRWARAYGLGNPSGWFATRVRILNRDNWTCRYCGVKANTVDHVVARVHGGSHDDDNLVAACRRCNGLKRDKSPEDVGFRLRD